MKKIIIVLFIVLSLVDAKEPLIIKYPSTSTNKDRDSFQIDLIKFLMDKVEVNYKLVSTKNICTQARAVSELKQGKDIDIFWMGTSPQLEKDLKAIRYPVYRGLLGHRIFIINKKDQKLFNSVQTLEDLQKFKGAQGIGWSDIAILEGSGLEQHAAKYENIFNIIDRGGRVAYFSRGLNEAFSEVSAREDRFNNLKVEEKIVLVYPFSMFLFVNKNNIKLTSLLNESFRKSYEDGSFKKFFYNHPKIKKSLKESNLENRVKIEIPNPFLTPATSMIKDKYWHGKSDSK